MQVPPFYTKVNHPEINANANKRQLGVWDRLSRRSKIKYEDKPVIILLINARLSFHPCWFPGVKLSITVSSLSMHIRSKGRGLIPIWIHIVQVIDSAIPANYSTNFFECRANFTSIRPSTDQEDLR